MSTSIDFPYSINQVGVTTAANTVPKIYVDRVLTLLSTNLGQRPMSPDYGVDWSGAMFENEGVASLAITQAVNIAIAKWVPEVEVTNISFSNINSDGNQVVSISLGLPDQTETVLSINSGSLNFAGNYGS